MRAFTDKEIAEMDLATASAEIANRVYEASLLFEQLEFAGKVRGNGHHIAQQVAGMAERLVVERWNTK